MPKINHEEYEVLKELDDKWEWIARDKNRGLYAFTKKPVKKYVHSRYWDVEPVEPYSALELCDEIHLFQFIQWEDENPHNIAELINDYEYKTGIFDWATSLGRAFRGESEETEVKKDKQWLEKELRNLEKLVKEALEASLIAKNEHYTEKNSNELQLLRRVFSLVNQLDEPEVLSSDWIDEHAQHVTGFGADKNGIDQYHDAPFVSVYDLQNLLVPTLSEMEKVEITEEPETVADVATTFWKSYERLKEVMSMEVEELEE